jgi:hypothetical protein
VRSDVFAFILVDVFIYYSFLLSLLTLRDRLSHCHADLTSVSHVLAQRVLQLIYYFSFQYNLQSM